MKRVVIVHGWGGPDKGWFKWLRTELENIGYEVIFPKMPDLKNPRIKPWVSTISEAVGEVDKNTYFVAHSMGCATAARFIETLPKNVIVGGVVFVAGFFLPLTPPGGEWHDGGETDAHWSSAPIDFDKVKSHINKSIAIFSDDDPWVPPENINVFKNKLDSKIIIEHSAGHLNENAGFSELPQALEAILELSK